MNPYKMRSIIEMIRKQGRLPRDQWDELLNPDDLLVWFELQGQLSPEEERELKRELRMMAEAEAFMDALNCKHV